MQVLEDRTEIGARVSAPLIAMALGCCLAALRVLPSASTHTAAYDLVSSAVRAFKMRFVGWEASRP